MVSAQGSLELLNNPVAQELLNSTELAHLAYNWSDGTPRVVPIWFHWNGQEIVVASPPTAPKVKGLSPSAKVALEIVGRTWPSHALMIRGTARVEVVDGVPLEYQASAKRYFGPEQGQAWIGQVDALFPQTARIKITPEWVGIIDFEQRFPSAIENAMADASGQG